MSFSFKRPEDSPGFMLWRLTTEWQRQQRQALKEIGLTHPQFVVLACIIWLSSQPDNVVTQQQVTEQSKIDKMSMSDLTQTLIRKKLIRRSEHKHDKRAYALTLTKRGRELTLKAIPIVEGIDKTFFNKENQGLTQFAQLL